MNENKPRTSWKRVLFGLKEEQTEEDKKIVRFICWSIIVACLAAFIIYEIIFYSQTWEREKYLNIITNNYKNPWFIILILALILRPFALLIIKILTGAPEEKASKKPPSENQPFSPAKDGKLKGCESFKRFLWFLLFWAIGTVFILTLIILFTYLSS
ncbi:hypothetical protein HYS99_00715 [Candidatus Giovannonibacteria bacterium]|nr:hypothetical protein [Candidatus Giovannonibacteria bacterium]